MVALRGPLEELELEVGVGGKRIDDDEATKPSALLARSPPW